MENIKEKIANGEELNQEDKQKIISVWGNLCMSLVDAIRSLLDRIKKAVKGWRKTINEKAAAGDRGALRAQAELELIHWNKRYKEIEGKLKVTKQTVARKKLLDQWRFVKQQVEKWETQKAAAMAETSETTDEGRKDSSR
ncbi:hypothetical protein [Cytobacillus kochii]|uniref:hypothetical protein n=1 Tax=Cytobacillus kochii TaxID=859143 RepID=UPI00402A812E